MKVWALQLSMKEDYRPYLGAISQDRQERIELLRHNSDRLRSVCGELLVRKYFSELPGMSHQAVRFTTGPYGKPYAANLPDVHFTVSHAGRWVVAAFAGLPVGIDVEQVQLPIDPAVPNLVMSAAELLEYVRLRDEEKGAYFYRVWTLKESFVKALGAGLSMDPATITLAADACMVNGNRISARFMEYDLDENYRTAVCVLGDAPIPAVAEQLEMSCFDRLLADIAVASIS